MSNNERPGIVRQIAQVNNHTVENIDDLADEQHVAGGALTRLLQEQLNDGAEARPQAHVVGRQHVDKRGPLADGRRDAADGFVQEQVGQGLAGVEDDAEEGGIVPVRKVDDLGDVMVVVVVVVQQTWQCLKNKNLVIFIYIYHSPLNTAHYDFNNLKIRLL